MNRILRPFWRRGAKGIHKLGGSGEGVSEAQESRLLLNLNGFLAPEVVSC